MKIVLNSCFGGFSVSEECMKALDLKSEYSADRCDPRLIKMVEEDSELVSGFCAKLRVVEIPDTATDWELTSYDGLEGIIYVLDGKLYHIDCD